MLKLLLSRLVTVPGAALSFPNTQEGSTPVATCQNIPDSPGSFEDGPAAVCNLDVTGLAATTARLEIVPGKPPHVIGQIGRVLIGNPLEVSTVTPGAIFRVHFLAERHRPSRHTERFENIVDRNGSQFLRPGEEFAIFLLGLRRGRLLRGSARRGTNRQRHEARRDQMACLFGRSRSDRKARCNSWNLCVTSA